MKRRLMVVFLTAAMMISSLAGCGNSKEAPKEAEKENVMQESEAVEESRKEIAESEKKYGGVLRFATANGCATPGYTPSCTSNTSLLYLNTAYESLIYYDETGAIIPRLATEWEVNVDEPSITWTLREGVKFSDGNDFNAEAVKVNIEEYQKAARTETANITSCEIIDDTHIKMVLESIDSSAVESIGFFVYFMSPKALAEPTSLETASCGTGPFQLVEFENNVFARYEKNENYWQEGKPYLDGIEITIITEATTMATAFRAGEYDMINIQNNATLANELKANSDFVMETNKSGQGLVCNGLIPNSADENSPWADERVRRALCYALDVDLLVQAFQFGMTDTTDQWAAKGSILYNDDINHYVYDPAKAKSLLAEAGYPDGFETKVYCAPLTKDLLTAAANMLEEVGIRCEIVQVDPATQTELYSTGTWDGLMVHFASISPDLGLYMGRHLDENGAFYAKGIQHPEAAMTLLEEIRAEVDTEKKVALSKEMQKLLYDAETGLAIFGRPLYIGYSANVKYDYVKDDGSCLAHVSTWNIENCWLDQ